MIKALIVFLTAAAQALHQRWKNERLRIQLETYKELYEAEKHYYQLQDAGVTDGRIDLSRLHLQSLREFKAEISTPVAQVVDDAGSLPSGAGTGDQKP